MLEILFIAYILLGVYLFISIEISMNEVAIQNGITHHWFKHVTAFTPILQVYIIYLSKKNRKEV